MKNSNNRRSFLKNLALGSLGTAVAPSVLAAGRIPGSTENISSINQETSSEHSFNGSYSGECLDQVAFPIGGLGAGMFCLEGRGAISHMSIRNRPEVFNEPEIFAAIHIKDIPNGVKLLEGPVPSWKVFGPEGSGNGEAGATYGLPRVSHAEFSARFPFGEVKLSDPDLPMKILITGWSPFIPTDEDNSSLPVGALEFEFTNTGAKELEAIFSFNTRNFLASDNGARNSILRTPNGFILNQEGVADHPDLEGSLAIFTTDDQTVVDHCWFRGGWWDPLTMTWNNVRNGVVKAVDPVEKDAPGASLFVPFNLSSGATKNICLMLAWYVPRTTLHVGEPVRDLKKNCSPETGCCSGPQDLGIQPGKQNPSADYSPWYSSRFKDIGEVIGYWKENYTSLKQNTRLFTDAFFRSSLPPEVMEAVAANLSILKSPTVLRQYDGRLWSWEGCGDNEGCCHGSCTHVWNYAQAMPHLFPSLERTLRNTEFCENQDQDGRQAFRANLPISQLKPDDFAAADGQLGGIMKVYRDWRISGDDQWLSRIYPMVKASLDYCIRTWDPRSKGVVEEPHHNTYDIEFWGPDGMCTSFYLGALKAMIEIGGKLGKPTETYLDLYSKGKVYLENQLFNGEYFFQQIEYKGLLAPNPADAKASGEDYSPEAIALLEKEGPKYQYGKGCMCDGILGAWIGRMCGMEDFIDPAKITSHLLAVHRHNLKKDLREHANPQRPNYALGKEGGLLVCSWPLGGQLSLPFPYSDEVWTGLEYQVASHLLLMGQVSEGLAIVGIARSRYDGRVRNPFDEYECGHWYARAMSSYGLLQGLTGIKYDAVEKALYIDSRVGDFNCFISTATGFGEVSLKAGVPSLKVAYGKIDVSRILVGGKLVPA